MLKINKEAFYKDVYSVVKEIPRGKVISYGEIARLIGCPQHARLVGKALSQVSPELNLPCHRVVNSQGILSGRAFFGNATTMMKLLESEGIIVINNRVQNWKHVFWNPMFLAES